MGGADVRQRQPCCVQGRIHGSLKEHEDMEKLQQLLD